MPSRRDSSRRVALIVTPQYLPMLGGMERECALLAQEFARRGYEPLVVTEQLGMDVPTTERDGPIEILRIPSSPDRSLGIQLRVAGRIAATLIRRRRQVAFAIVRTVTLPALVVGLLKMLRLVSFPTLVTAEIGGDEDDVVALARRPLFGLSRALVSANDRLNGICEANADHFRAHGFPEEKITSIPNGVDTSAWSSAVAPERVRKLLYLGRMDPAKGLFELLDALVAVRAAHAEVTLTVAGSGPVTEEFLARCDALGLGECVTFLGRVQHERVGALLEEHDCLVLPSYSEGMPLSVLEAAVRRRALVVSDVGDMRRLFGDSAYLCAPRDRASLEAALLAAVEDPAPAADYAAVIEAVDIRNVANLLIDALQAQEPTGVRLAG